MKTVYVILSATGTRPARLIRFVTKNEYSHASIALVPSPKKLYSFGRRRVKNFLVGGFINEDTRNHVMGLFPHAPCVVLALKVSQRAYDKMEMMIEECNRQHKRYKYSFVGAFTTFVGIKKRLKYHYTCSQFVASLLYLSDAVELPKHPSLMKPEDFLDIPDFKVVYQGELSKISFDSDEV